MREGGLESPPMKPAMECPDRTGDASVFAVALTVHEFLSGPVTPLFILLPRGKTSRLTRIQIKSGQSLGGVRQTPRTKLSDPVRPSSIAGERIQRTNGAAGIRFKRRIDSTRKAKHFHRHRLPDDRSCAHSGRPLDPIDRYQRDRMAGSNANHPTFRQAARHSRCRLGYTPPLGMPARH